MDQLKKNRIQSPELSVFFIQNGTRNVAARDLHSDIQREYSNNKKER